MCDMWLLPVIGTHLAWALENVATKVIIGSKVRNPYVFLIIFSVIEIILLPFVPAQYIVKINLSSIGLILLASCFYTMGSLPYVKAVEIEEVTRINILWNLIPVFTLILGYFIVGDKISLKEFAAMVVLITGAIVASLKTKNNNFKLSKAIYLMVLATFAYSVYAVLIRFLSTSLSFATIFFYTMLGNIFWALTLLFSRKLRQACADQIMAFDRRMWLVFVVLVFLGGLGTLLNQYALTIKTTAIVYSLEGLQVLFVFIISAAVTKFYPKSLDESFDRKSIFIKFVAFFIIVFGIFLLNSKS